MTRITLIYRDSEGAHFDFDYYVNHHIAMSRRLMANSGLTSIQVQKCLRGMDGGKPNVLCITHVDFDSEESLTKALDTHGAVLMADFPNYTNISPAIYVCDILTSGL